MIILLGMMYLTTNAQSITIRGGLNLSNIRGDNSYDMFGDTKMKPGFHFGLMSDFTLSDQFSLETGLLLSHRGFKIKESGSYEFDGQQIPYSVELKYSAYYLTLPFTAKMRFPLNRDTDFYVQAGGYVGYGLFGNGEFSLTDNGEKESDKEKEDWEYTSRIDAGLTVGTGVEINSLLLGVFYDLGLVPVFDGEGYYSNLNLSLGYRLFSRN